MKPGDRYIGRLRVIDDGDDETGQIIYLATDDDEEVVIAEILEFGLNDAKQLATAETLRDCWNTLEGIDPAAVADLRESLQAAHDTLDTICKAGHVHIVSAALPHGHGLDSFRAALAKASTATGE